jgi:hypothetical protein
MAKTEPLTVRFSPREYELLTRAAQVEDRSRGAVVRRLVDQLDMPRDEPMGVAKTDRSGNATANVRDTVKGR